MSPTTAARAIAKIAFLALFTHLLSFYLGLGYVLFLVWPAGAVAALLLTLPELRATRNRFVAGAAVVLFYAAALFGLFHALFGHRDEMTFRARLDVREVRESDERELSLRFVDHPGHAFVRRFGAGETDAMLAAAERTGAPLTVTLVVTRDLGCPRGFYVHSLDGVPFDSTRFIYETRGEGALWPRPWWCP